MEPERGNKIAYQGEPGAYSEAAIIEHFGENIETLPCESFELVFEAIRSSQATFGFLPIENSLAGSIHRNYDLLLQQDLSVIGEHYLHVHHCLIGLPGAELSGIRIAISHPQALAQCDGNLRRLGIRSEPAYDTAGSVKLMQEAGDPALAAIASARAAGLYDMQILLENLEDNPENYTRFLIVSNEKTPDKHPLSTIESKTSIVFSLKNEPGALFKALSVFALRDIDLTKIESRPVAGRPWEYSFYIDFTGSAGEERCRKALDHLGEYAPFLRILGSYPKG